MGRSTRRRTSTTSVKPARQFRASLSCRGSTTMRNSTAVEVRVLASGLFNSDLAPDDLLQRVRLRAGIARRPDAIVGRRKAQALAARRPELREEWLTVAERAMGGMLVLPGTRGEPHFVGAPPRWMHREVPDEEYSFSLNRMDHWKLLLSAHALTGERRFAEKVTEELRDWLATCRRPPLDPARAQELFNGGVTPGHLRAGMRLLERWPGASRYVHAARGAVRSIGKQVRRRSSSGGANGAALAALP